VLGGATFAPFTILADQPDPRATYTRYTVTFAGVELGRQISQPSRADCFDHARRAIAAGKVNDAIAEQLRAHGVVGAPVLRLPKRNHMDHARRRGGRKKRAA
jgi:hypothetical protein